MKGGGKMKRMMRILLILASFAVGYNLSHAGDGAKVLMIPRDGVSSNLELMLTKEVGVMTDMLKNAGFDVDVATVTGQPIVASETLKLKPDLKLSNVNVADYAGIIMPCMSVGGGLNTPVASEAVAIVKGAVAERKPVAAQLGSVMILAEAGVLKGKKYAYFFDKLNPDSAHQRDARFEGAIYSNEIVVKDGNIITSCCCPAAAYFHGSPDATAQLTQTLIDELIHK
jgi:putative intracellular protease/amidase